MGESFELESGLAQFVSVITSLLLFCDILNHLCVHLAVLIQIEYVLTIRFIVQRGRLKNKFVHKWLLILIKLDQKHLWLALVILIHKLVV